jgi:RNA polymerase sigma-70 factor (ECF subfamily)
LGELLSVYRNYLLFLASIQIDRRLQGKAGDSDLVQETYLRAHCHFQQFRGHTEGEFAAWLRGILVGVVANHVRSYLGTKQRDARLERGLAVEIEGVSGILDRGLVAATNSPSQDAVRHESSLLLAEALQRLPEDYRRTIILRDFEGLSFADIATRMGRSVDSVQKLWVRALAQLRQGLLEEPT